MSISIEVKSSATGLPVMARGMWHDMPLPWWHWLTARDSWNRSVRRERPRDGVAIVIRRVA